MFFMTRILLILLTGALLACGEAKPTDPDLAAARGLSITQIIETFDPPTAGKVVFHRRSCTLCHTTDGSRRVGPSLNAIYGTERPLVDGTHVLADDAYLHESILFAGKQIVAGYRGDMPRYQRVLEPGEVDALVAYIKSLPAAPLAP